MHGPECRGACSGRPTLRPAWASRGPHRTMRGPPVSHCGRLLWRTKRVATGCANLGRPGVCHAARSFFSCSGGGACTLRAVLSHPLASPNPTFPQTYFFRTAVASNLGIRQFGERSCPWQIYITRRCPLFTPSTPHPHTTPIRSPTPFHTHTISHPRPYIQYIHPRIHTQYIQYTQHIQYIQYIQYIHPHRVLRSTDTL